MKKLLLGVLVYLLYACGSGNEKPNEQAILDSLEAQEQAAGDESPAISDQALASILQQIPSPLEISVLLKESGANYDKSLLNPINNKSKYNSNYDKALNLGVYGTDLGYTNIYERNQDALDYLNSIKELADELSIGQFFNIGMIRRLATNSRNLDSLLLITTKNFNSINEYLQDQQRSNLSVLLLAGGWVEALHILCQVVDKNPNSEDLRERIGEQKITLEQIMLLLNVYSQTNPNMRELQDDMQNLKNIFDQVEVTTTYEESTLKEENGIVTIENNSSSTINMSDQVLQDITSTAASIRGNVIN